MSLAPTLSLVFLAASGAVAVQTEPAPARQEAADAAAQEQWRRTIAASRRAGTDPAPIHAFRLRANVLTRQRAQSNEAEVDLAYLEPDLIRFSMPDGKEVGRTGTKRRDHWLKSQDRVVELTGREYEEDRRQIQSMHAIARNFIALSDPARLAVTDVRMLGGARIDLPRPLQRAARKLVWISLTSADFDLGTGSQGPLRVEFALETDGPDVDLPRLAILRAAGEGGDAPPMLLALENYGDLDGFRVPHTIEVYAPDASSEVPRFAERPAQEIYLLPPSSLRPALSAKDFAP